MSISINNERCNACGICGRVCPRHIPETIQKNGNKVTQISPLRVDMCMECAHCAAVCPTGAIQVDSIPAEAYTQLAEQTVTPEALQTLMRQRRSVRRYKSKPVQRDILDQIAGAAHAAPTGAAHPTTGVIIIDKPDILSAFSETLYKNYEALQSAIKSPIARQFVKRSAGKDELRTLEAFVMPGMEWYIRWYQEGKSNEILRDCPVLMLFHSPIDEPVTHENCIIAAFHAIFMAETLGVGTCFNDLVPPICNRSEKVRTMLGLPADREVYASLTMGYPKYTFQRVPPRSLAEIRYLN